jgi:DNA repair protein RadC
MSTRDLLLVAGVDKSELEHAERALGLLGGARTRAIQDLKRGAQLLAAIELGRRAWMLPSPAGRRLRAPVDVAAVCAPRMSDDTPHCLALALDKRLTVARITGTAPDAAAIVRAAMAADTTRVVVALNRRGQRAVPDLAHSSLVDELAVASNAVGVAVLDVVLLGDDGFCSLLRLGMLSPTDPRYR